MPARLALKKRRGEFKHWREAEREFRSTRDRRLKVSLHKVELCSERDESQEENPSGKSET